MSSINGSGYEFNFVILFNFLKSTQNLFVPSFLSEITTGKLYGDFDLEMILASIISSTTLSMVFLLFKGVLYGLSLIGG